MYIYIYYTYIIYIYIYNIYILYIYYIYICIYCLVFGKKNQSDLSMLRHSKYETNPFGTACFCIPAFFAHMEQTST